MDMTDQEYRLYQARQRAGAGYRAEGFFEFAGRVEAGREDECRLMRIARFFIEPTSPHPLKFIIAWNELVAAGDHRSEHPKAHG
jgi:hypothetical protein